MKVLLDTNIVVDVLLAREPHLAASADLLSRVETGQISGYLGATTVTTLHYLTAKAVGSAQASHQVRKILSICEIAPIQRSILESALDAGFPDFEDAVLHEAARQVAAEAIVTRNARHFRKSVLPVYSPEELCRALQARERLAAPED